MKILKILISLEFEIFEKRRKKSWKFVYILIKSANLPLIWRIFLKQNSNFARIWDFMKYLFNLTNFLFMFSCFFTADKVHTQTHRRSRSSSTQSWKRRKIAPQFLFAGSVSMCDSLFTSLLWQTWNQEKERSSSTPQRHDFQIHVWRMPSSIQWTEYDCAFVHHLQKTI